MDLHIVAVTAVVMSPDNKRFLIIKRSANEVAFPGKWAFPGGKVNKGETLEVAIKREVLEETGLVFEEVSYCGDFTFVRPDGYNVVGLRFVGKAKSDGVKLGRGFDGSAWVLPSELCNFDHIPGLENELSKLF